MTPPRDTKIERRIAEADKVLARCRKLGVDPVRALERACREVEKQRKNKQ